MPELPDVTVYLEALEARVLGRVLRNVRIAHPFLLRSVDPPVGELHSRRVAELRRLGKRIVFAFEGDLFLVLHLMIAGRLHWRAAAAAAIPAPIPKGRGLAAFDFETGTLLLTEAGKKRRAWLHVVRGEEALRLHDPGGLEVLESDLETFRARFTARNHTLKRALTDPHIVAGIGGAYADEVLHRARLSPIAQTQKLGAGEVERLYAAIREVLPEWCERLRREAGGEFPEGVTAFRDDMAVHGRFGKPCPDCGTPVQRIRYASTETNYCPACQTGGRLLADRGLSRLLRDDWPKTLEELEDRFRAGAGPERR